MLKTGISAKARARGRRQRGVTLIELVVTLALLGIFMAMAAPSFSNWLQNSRIRNTATALSAGIQLAKAEAVARNTGVRFQLTSSLTNDCAISTSGNYGEIFERNVGPKSDLQLPRGLNNLWNKGGIQYAPPIR